MKKVIQGSLIFLFTILLLVSCAPKSRTTNVILEMKKNTETVKIGDVLVFKLDASPKFGTIDGEEEKSFQFMVLDSTPPEIKRLEIFPERPQPNQSPLNVFLDVVENEAKNLNVSVYVDDEVYDFFSSK